MALEGITLLTEPAYPTRTGNSVSRDMCPDLTMGINLPQPRWWNSQENLGSDHFIIHTFYQRRDQKKLSEGYTRLPWRQRELTPCPTVEVPPHRAGSHTYTPV
ncbi:hypothetical protein HPB52_018124 [Rhipicephalus sanguineus]|uniref:Tick transposon n=1 Tax=Rhipicephalus sanguineus TaxID=34632 RepID=A0A9D4QH66_RHISA|nr:hypothetical protein HPB52_018124 [Rhipicephalus sanguineus]